MQFDAIVHSPQQLLSAFTSEMASLLQIDASRIIVTRLLRGSVVVEFIVQPGGETSSMDAIHRLESLHENGASELYDTDRYGVISRIDPDTPIEYQDVRDGISGMTIIVVGSTGLFLILVAIYLQFRNPRRKQKPYAVSPVADNEVKGAATDNLPEVTTQNKLWKKVRLLTATAQVVLDCLFTFLCLQSESEFAFETDKYKTVAAASMGLLLGVTPLATAAVLLILTRNKTRIRNKSGAGLDGGDKPKPAGRICVFRLWALLCPEVLCLLPWDASQEETLSLACAGLSAMANIPQLMFQLEYSSREGGFDLASSYGQIATLAMVFTLLSIVTRVIGRFVSVIMSRYAQRIAKMRNRLKDLMPDKDTGPPLWKVKQEAQEALERAGGKVHRQQLPLLETKPAWQRKVETEAMVGVVSDEARVGSEVTKGAVAAGVAVTKVWRLKNLGVEIWPKGTHLVRIGGDAAISTPHLPQVQPCGAQSETDVLLEFDAPAEAGTYVAYFRLADKSDQEFGQRLWVMLRVEDIASLVAAASELPPSAPQAISMAPSGKPRTILPPVVPRLEADRKRDVMVADKTRRALAFRDERHKYHPSGFSIHLMDGSRPWTDKYTRDEKAKLDEATRRSTHNVFEDAALIDDRGGILIEDREPAGGSVEGAKRRECLAPDSWLKDLMPGNSRWHENCIKHEAQEALERAVVEAHRQQIPLLETNPATAIGDQSQKMVATGDRRSANTM
jgi:hypothetical protein